MIKGVENEVDDQSLYRRTTSNAVAIWRLWGRGRAETSFRARSETGHLKTAT